MTVFVEVFEALVVGGIVFYIRQELANTHNSLGNIFVVFMDALVELLVADFSELTFECEAVHEGFSHINPSKFPHGEALGRSSLGGCYRDEGVDFGHLGVGAGAGLERKNSSILGTWFLVGFEILVADTHVLEVGSGDESSHRVGNDVYFGMAFVPKIVVLIDFVNELCKEGGCDSVVLFPIISKNVQASFGASFDMNFCWAIIVHVLDFVLVLFEAVDEAVVGVGDGIGNPAFYFFFFVSVFTVP